MKKALFSFAIVAAGLLVASCGNKSGNAKEAEAVEAEVVDETPVPTKAECDDFTLTAPAGLKFNENASSSTSVTLDVPDYGQFESVTIYRNEEEKSADNLLNQYYGDGANKEKAGDVTIGNLTFKQLYYTESADNNCDLFAEVEGGVLVLSLSRNVPVEAEFLKPLVESIMFK